MKLSTRVTLLGMFLVGVVVVLAAVLLSTTRAVKLELGKNEAASDLVNAVTGLRHLMLESSLRVHEEPQAPWRLSHDAMSKLLASASQQSNATDADIFSALRQSNDKISSLFSELLQGQQRAKLSAEVEAGLSSQIIAQLESITAGALALSQRSRAGVLHAQQRASEAVVIVAVFILFVVLVATYATFESVSRPLARLRQGTAIVGAGNLDFRLEVTSRGELGELARAFNEMTARLAADRTERKRARDAMEQIKAELARVARVAVLGEITASIAHEINQPLGAIATNASAGLNWLAADNFDEARNSAVLVIADSHRASQVVARIRTMIRKAPPQRQWIDINDALEATLVLAQSEAAKHRIEVLSRLSDAVPRICVDKIQIQQVVLNLVANAIEAMRAPAAAGNAHSLIVSSEPDDADAVRISVRDSGAGVSPEHADEIFDAFYTTKADGLGMGLAVSRSIVEAHYGRLWATANEDRGATFQFTLPVGGPEMSW